MNDEERERDDLDFEGQLKFLQDTPHKLLQLVEGLSEPELRWRNSDSDFSMVENICHLRDIEAEGYTARINRILDETNPFLPDIDGARLAVERDYNSQNVEATLQLMTEARIRNIERLRLVDQKQLEREGMLEGVGNVSLRKLVVMMTEHDENHISDLRSLRKQLSVHLT
jgi:DinB family protein